MMCDKGTLDLDKCLNSGGYSPLTYATAIDNTDAVNYLTLRKGGCAIDQEDPNNVTPFTKYVLFENFELARKLLQRGANIDYTNREGKTVLVIATQQKLQ